MRRLAILAALLILFCAVALALAPRIGLDFQWPDLCPERLAMAGNGMGDGMGNGLGQHDAGCKVQSDCAIHAGFWPGSANRGPASLENCQRCPAFSLFGVTANGQELQPDRC